MIGAGLKAVCDSIDDEPGLPLAVTGQRDHVGEEFESLGCHDVGLPGDRIEDADAVFEVPNKRGKAGRKRRGCHARKIS